MSHTNTAAFLSALQKSIKKMDSRCWEAVKDEGLTKNEVIVLLFLSNHHPLDTAKDIIKYRGISKAHASKSIEHLIQKGYLTSCCDASDRRIQHLQITPDTQDIIQKINCVRNHFLENLLNGLSKEQLATLKMITQTIQKNSEDL